MKAIRDHAGAVDYKAEGCDDLPVVRATYEGAPVLISCWHLTPLERLRVLFGGRLWLGVLGTRHPPVTFWNERPYAIESEALAAAQAERVAQEAAKLAGVTPPNRHERRKSAAKAR